ncbi:SagB family peptide dehydrogenase [Nonomuraea sp. NPDC046570]|uniref:SagB family peptide dehydrogenase n=1 Tax=Nonomuraea sp. NPDC046570 TaxID=3155255 RepID=UPI0033D7EB10
MSTAVRRYLAVSESQPVEAIMATDWTLLPALVKRYPRAAAQPPPPALADLLRRSYGFTRYQWDNWHSIAGQEGLGSLAMGRALRAVPSGGGLFPTELYLVGSAPGLPCGAYHYDPAADALDLVRAGAHPRDLGLDGTDLCLVLGSVHARTAFKYREFAYRLQCLDAGVLTGQLLAVLDADGTVAEAVLRFDEDAVSRVLGLDPGAEAVMAMVAVRRHEADEAKVVSEGRAAWGDASEDVAVPTERTRPPALLDQLPLTRDLRAAARASARDTAPAVPPLAPPAGEAVELPEVAVRLTDGCAERRSLDGRFAAGPLTAGQLAALTAAGAGGWHGDVGPGHLLLSCLVHDVAGVPPGAYVYDRHRLNRVGEADRGLPRPPVLGDHGGAVALFPVGDYESGTAAQGDGWYRMQNVVAGVAVQRLLLAAAALGLGSRVLCAYDTGDVARRLGLGGSLRPLCQVLVGPVGSTISYTQEIR